MARRSANFALALEATRKVATEAAGPNAAAVDRDARFPVEAIDALKRARLLSAGVPVELGGLGLSLGEQAELCCVLGQACAATAMITAMHFIQIGCIARHRGDSAWFTGYLRECVERQLLIASITSEVGVGGDARTSVAGVRVEGGAFALTKQATTISYGAHADDWFATCRRSPDAPGNDQVLVMLRRGSTTLSPTTTWNTLGMRGTCSPGFSVHATGDAAQILPDYGTVSAKTMVPYSHVLWGGTWLGIATDAVHRARAYLRGEARKAPGKAPPQGLRVSELATQLAVMRALVHDVARDVEEVYETPGADEALATIAWALRLNQLKIAASQAVFDITVKSLQTIGIMAYKQDSPASLGRHLRDALSASLMVGNDRLHATNAAFLCVFKDD
ncbi:MAG: acyl-CoA dehydrogenase family protein [Kofleriaceae bacterium]